MRANLSQVCSAATGQVASLEPRPISTSSLLERYSAQGHDLEQAMLALLEELGAAEASAA